MKWLFIIGAVVLLLWCSVCFRLFLSHPISSVIYAVKDTYFYFKHNERYRYDGGVLNAYFAHFGGGKTLTVTQYVTQLYARYNNKYVWDRDKQTMVLQKIHIISNVHLQNAPYESLESLSQIVCCAYRNKDIDKKQDTRTCVLVILDEASSQLNSREFKTNINADFLNALITSRHFHMSIFYTTQKFKLVDALLRSVTQRAIKCDKIWRFMCTKVYDADELEYAANPTLVQPIKRGGWFIRDRDYNNYDTLATVDKLRKQFDSGDFMTEQEILEMRGAMNPDTDAITRPSRMLKRLRKK